LARASSGEPSRPDLLKLDTQWPLARNPDHVDLTAFAADASVRVADSDTAIDDAEAVLPAINGAAMPKAVPTLRGRMDGKIVVDTTNYVGAQSLNTIGRARSQRSALLRFDSLGWENFANAPTGTTPPTCSTPAVRARPNAPWRT
jgi:hypothetical protein